MKRLEQFFEDAVTRANKNIEDPQVKALLDKVAVPLTNTYVNHYDDLDTKTRVSLIKLLSAFRDARTEPAVKKAFEEFSHSLKEDDFDKGMKVHDDLIENDEIPKEQLEKIKINTLQLFKNNFQFPEVAKNDFASELFDGLEIAEKNLNSNLDNVDLFNTFVETAEAIKK